MTAAVESPDIRQLQGESLPAGDFPAGGRQDYRVFFAPAVHQQIWKHASENVALEICGVLVGTWQRDDVGPFVTISEFIRCDSARSGFAEVTFTHESWTKINAEMDTRLSAFKIVGWYHSHPDFGIFLSDRDIFIHQHFFSGAGQIAYVVDPVRKIEGVFAWQAGKPVLRPHFWVGERVFVTPDRPPPEEIPQAQAVERLAGPAGPPGSRWGWVGTLTTTAMFACVFLLGFLLAGRRTDLERQLERQRELEGLVVYFARLGVLRPGLEDELSKVSADLHAVRGDVATLADRHVKLAAADKENQALKEKWNTVHDRLAGTERHLGQVRQAYSLRPDEQAVVKDVVQELVNLVDRELKSQRQAAGTDPKSGQSAKTTTADEQRKSDDPTERGKKKSAPPDAKSRKSGDKHGPSED